MTDGEQYRRELEELEGGNAGRSNVVVPFDTEKRAAAFAAYLKETLDIDTSPKYVSNSSVDPATSSSQWDMDVPGVHLFKVKLLYTLFQKGIRLGAIPDKPLAVRTRYLVDRLVGTAILRGGWSDPPCAPTDLTWYCDAARIDRKEIPAMVAAAKEEFRDQRASEKKWSVLGGASLLLAGGGAIATGNDLVGYGLLVAGATLVIFSFTR